MCGTRTRANEDRRDTILALERAGQLGELHPVLFDRIHRHFGLGRINAEVELAQDGRCCCGPDVCGQTPLLVLLVLLVLLLLLLLVLLVLLVVLVGASR